MSKIATVPSHAAGSGLALSTKEDSRWGYVREDDDDSNSAFVFSQTYPSKNSQSTLGKISTHERQIDNGNATTWPQKHVSPTAKDISTQPYPVSTHHPGTDNTESASTRLDAPRRNIGDLSRNGSEADSLLDLYRQQRAGVSVIHNGVLNGDMASKPLSHEELERERWIHRDKLAVIESQEARAAGVKIPREFDVDRYSEAFKAETYTQEPEELLDRGGSSDHDRGLQRMQSYSPTGDDSGDEALPDPRSPEEIAADLAEDANSPRFQSQHGLRSSSSRIPLATASPIPIPQEHLDRNTRLPRKRGTSGTWDDDGLMYNKPRSRSHSAGSHVLLDDDAPGSPSQGALSGSPSKARSPTKAQPTSGVKRPTNGPRTASATQKLRSTSATPRGSPAQRPPTRSGPDGRPSTATNRPEGDPPWLATMYKPDPRLPPDQQIIPTHAKRLQQEQWEREGKPGSVFDRDFTPLAINTSEGPPNGVQKPQEDNMEWPLKTPPAEPSKPMGLPSSGGEHAGYSTIPKVPSTPDTARVQSPRLPQPMEVHRPVQHEQEKEKGCGCCIVM